jgi:hypothetical protein
MIVLDNGDKLRGDAAAAAVIDYTIYGTDDGVVKQLADGQLADTTGDLYTADSVDVVTTVVLVNTDTVTRAINLFVLPSGGTARRVLAKDLALEAESSLHWSGDKVSVMNALGKTVVTTEGDIGVSGAPIANDIARFTSSNAIEGRSYTEIKSDLSLEIGTDVLAEQTIGIADDNLLEVDGTPISAEYARFTANGLEGRTESEFKSDYNLTIGTDVLAEQTIGIADNNLLEVDDATAADNEFAKFTANGLEGRSYAEVRTDINVADGADVTADSAAVMEAVFAAKGDILSASADDTPLILSVGSNTNVLVANSTTATGLEWVAAGAPGAHKDSHDPEDGADALDSAAPNELTGVVASATGTAHSFARSDHSHQLQHSIANNRIVTIDDTDAANGDYAKFTASGLESKTIADMQTELGIANQVNTSGTPVANDIARFTDADTIEGRSYTELKTDLSLVPGTDVQAYSAGLLSLAGLTETNGGIPYGTADNTYAWLAAGAEGALLMGNGAGAPSFLAAGATSEILVGGGAADPVWTTATGTGAPVRGTAPTLTAATLAGTLSCADQLVARPEVKDYSETVKVHGSLSGATDADLEDGNVHTFEVGGAFTLSLTNPPANTKAGSITFIITNGDSSTLTWDPDIDWVDGTAPVLTETGVDVVTCITTDAGTTWLGFVVGLDVQ